MARQLTGQDAHNLLVLLDVAMKKGAYGVAESGVIATVGRKLNSIKEEAANGDSDSTGQHGGEEPPAV